MPILPGATIGILGGGQLGRMLALAAAPLGYKVHVFAPEGEAVALDVAAGATRAEYTDEAALAAFAAACDVITYEFENVPSASVAFLEGLKPVRPGHRALDVAQDRLSEKQFVTELGGRPAPFRAVETLAELEAALAELGAPAILKTRRFGYDGKGQVRIGSVGEAAEAFAALGSKGLILEGFVRFSAEFSILVARCPRGREVHYPACLNVHEDGILALTSVPAGIDPAHVDAATALVVRIADALDYVGVLACEFFATPDGPVFNEMAPRVHNSGHWSIEGAETSQFEQHVRAICGLPLGPVGLKAPLVEMRNLLGDTSAEWPRILADPTAHLHLYGKADAAPGRKMGHVTRLLRERP
ncbi:5-(carboxyamino)imidazole ribonucleotide synthase [Sandaracinobacter neustonicus]|uniref:N5-carboxyaminoimidazole ribonucleotide synthase n=1 Tax=Sandaracinobacter neustonicus TaxID=1715348 RepID=A0A501XPU9_9SPHN|nr:5-(carboxyamino)imidazole ribonucleotide synthase [Sandaracinobacter neustonicus]TPE62137.1 5-(carboxyamino)imidazole ribonucleotide synthase [Sandaracinobacter neustonicus]